MWLDRFPSYLLALGSNFGSVVENDGTKIHLREACYTLSLMPQVSENKTCLEYLKENEEIDENIMGLIQDMKL